jgi:hypothetical protein
MTGCLLLTHVPIRCTGKVLRVDRPRWLIYLQHFFVARYRITFPRVLTLLFVQCIVLLQKMRFIHFIKEVLYRFAG